MNLSPDETKLANEAKKGLNEAKQAMRDAMKAMRGLMAIQESAGRAKEYAAAYRVWVEMDLALNGVHRAHATATEAMCGCYADGGVVIFGGGGGR